MTAVRPHDLVRLGAPEVLLTGDAPGWVGDALARVPWVVVRRATATAGLLAVGVRGTGRHQRHAAEAPPAAVTGVAAPERLRSPPRHGPACRTPALVALHDLGPALDARKLVWGPVGSAGFELATGQPATGTESDLDIIVRMHELPDPGWAADLLTGLTDAAARVDCLLETPAGAVALAELAGGPALLVLRTADGPRLVTPEQVQAMCARRTGTVGDHLR
ncbi:malonate decarboxylase holo-ACP synthase [Catellatospora paridis]|uniref:malonate decarboxylase holo-ACP synthase n=1 Tax=Catellatospora paridis TaxID=1617086 RepID=UPI0012D381AC|nr:malonate decarboxylase holo-ACP synthase [Catellatospora paridis]